jgi:general secretion pathway protein G
MQPNLMELQLVTQAHSPIDVKKNGFTLVEVIIVTALILLISLTAFQTAEIVNTREKEERMRHALLEMRAAMDKFHQDQLRFPNTFDELLTTVVPGKGGFYLRRLPLNPMFGESRWEIASRTSIDGSYNHWEEITASSQGMSDGAPILDVRCPPAAGTGLNGIEYQNW